MDCPAELQPTSITCFDWNTKLLDCSRDIALLEQATGGSFWCSQYIWSENQGSLRAGNCESQLAELTGTVLVEINHSQLQEFKVKVVHVKHKPRFSTISSVASLSMSLVCLVTTLTGTTWLTDGTEISPFLSTSEMTVWQKSATLVVMNVRTTFLQLTIRSWEASSTSEVNLSLNFTVIPSISSTSRKSTVTSRTTLALSLMLTVDLA